jgi:hypothetical protein
MCACMKGRACRVKGCACRVEGCACHVEGCAYRVCMSCAYHPRIKYHVGGGVQAKAAGGANNDWKLTHTLVHAHKGSDGSSPSLQVCLCQACKRLRNLAPPRLSTILYVCACPCVGSSPCVRSLCLGSSPCICLCMCTRTHIHEHEVGEKGREKGNGSHVHTHVCIRA